MYENGKSPQIDCVQDRPWEQRAFTPCLLSGVKAHIWVGIVDATPQPVKVAEEEIQIKLGAFESFPAMVEGIFQS